MYVDFQFSGDESRRLFNNGVKAPEHKLENGNFNGITYGSVVFQLKDANLEANGSCDFVFRALKVVCKTRIVTHYLVLLSLLPVLMLIVGERRCDAAITVNHVFKSATTVITFEVHAVISNESSMVFG